MTKLWQWRVMLPAEQSDAWSGGVVLLRRRAEGRELWAIARSHMAVAAL